MTNRDLIVVGASAGGVEALRALVAGLPAGLPAAVLVVLHVPRGAPSALPQILARSGRLPAAAAVDGEVLTAGRIYVAPADLHLMVIDGRVRLSHGPAENGHRPAVDPLFRSAVRALGDRVVAVVLSGSGDDGAAGAEVVAAAGGLVVVQDPAEALHPSMPRAALTRVPSALVKAAAGLGELLAQLTKEEVAGLAAPVDPLLVGEVAIEAFDEVSTDQLPVSPSGFGCPSCGGALFTLGETPVPRFRCRIGHAWSPESLLDEQAVATESALWLALRALEERAELGRRMAGSAGGRVSGRFEQMTDDAEKARVLIRALLDQLARSNAIQQE
ncbi:two-component system chemotaxis response regulator CheB [Actinoplanes octamycinicus]|uniref:protein-glutamate methylesterase n=1 Tax=Actinoplanes octamycinicus TaxID=135948 RepID=A0A7W7H4W4_9ACTN|nr:chemotaxis protein CheB [Actinoplanes octamycinicus]MBB4743864.1 two-component system chemotaxis response regulator CheB [Actinoplanes octamycinicus]GIE58493.1 chemotaxis protein CheB [Actinoplanes octamycinicus]